MPASPQLPGGTVRGTTQSAMLSSQGSQPWDGSGESTFDGD